MALPITPPHPHLHPLADQLRAHAELERRVAPQLQLLATAGDPRRLLRHHERSLDEIQLTRLHHDHDHADNDGGAVEGKNSSVFRQLLRLHDDSSPAGPRSAEQRREAAVKLAKAFEDDNIDRIVWCYRSRDGNRNALAVRSLRVSGGVADEQSALGSDSIQTCNNNDDDANDNNDADNNKNNSSSSSNNNNNNNNNHSNNNNHYYYYYYDCC